MEQNISNQTITEPNAPTSTGLKSHTEKEESIRSVSHCSCSQCKLDDCFKLRKHNSFCSCKACEQAKITADLNINNPENPKLDEKSNTHYDNDSFIKSKIMEAQKEIFPEMTGEFSEINNPKYTKYRCKDISLKKEKIYWNTEKQSYEKSSTKKYIHSVTFTYSPKEPEDSAVKLSAQVMDMPYEEVKDSLGVDTNKEVKKKDVPSEDCKDILVNDKDRKIENEQENTSSPLNSTNVIKPDILTRLKEIYKACSCKLCECITNPPPISNNNYCGCSPCDCKLCTNISNKYTNDVRPPHSGCPCVKCDRKDCKGVVKTAEGENCDCKPCECVECVDSMKTSCSCLPCQCVECVASGLSFPQSMVVAPLHGNFLQNGCKCKPCGCDNCTHNYTAMFPNFRRKISTDNISSQENCDGCSDYSYQIISEDCRYGRRSKDYNVHRTVKTNCNDMKKRRNQDTIAMYALSNNYSNFMPISKASCDKCHCLECECFFCDKKEKYENENKKVNCETFKKYSELSTDISSTCKCSLCDCPFCSRWDKRSNELGLKCFQKYCDCLMCKGLLHASYNAQLRKNNRSLKEVPFSPLTEEVTFPRRGRIFMPLKYKTESLNYKNPNKEKSKHNNMSHELFVPNRTFKSLNSQELDDMFFEHNYALNARAKLKKTEASFDSLGVNEICNSSKQYLNRDKDLLLKCIYLAKSHSKIDLESDFNTCIKEPKNLIDPGINFNLSNKTVNRETSKKAGESISATKIVDKIPAQRSSCYELLSKEFKNILANKDEYIQTIEKDKTINCYGKTKPYKFCYHKKIKSKNKTFNKTYKSVIKRKNHKVNKTISVITDDKSNNINTVLNSGVLTVIEKLIDNVNFEINNIKNFALETNKNFGEIETIFTDEMDENRNISVGNKSWPILKKNLYLRCTHSPKKEDYYSVTKLNLLKRVKSISMQTMECPRISQQRCGKQALTQLLIEVKELLDSPLLQSSQASKESCNLTETLNLPSKNDTGTKYKSLCSDAVSQTIKKIIFVDKETNCNFLQPMESLYKSMKLLVNWVLSKAAYKSEISKTKYNLTHECLEEYPQINSAKSSCEGRKAAFIGLRAISNHTVLVKWSLPREIVCVQGYELQVDGRPVQKIFSPTRCMAVLTCLPHSDKLLLTIRTLTSDVPSDHNPASTIVYRPRIK